MFGFHYRCAGHDFSDRRKHIGSIRRLRGGILSRQTGAFHHWLFCWRNLSIAATRMFARHVGKFIPGNPNVWVDNMTGAGGLIATNYLANAAPRDGTVLLNLDGALLRLQTLGNAAAKFDARQFNWLSSPGPDIQVCWVSKTSGWSSIAEAFGSSKELKLGGLAPGTFPSDNARILQAALGINCQACGWFQRSYRNPTCDGER